MDEHNIPIEESVSDPFPAIMRQEDLTILNERERGGKTWREEKEEEKRQRRISGRKAGVSVSVAGVEKWIYSQEVRS